MKTLNYKSGKSTISTFFLLMVLATSIGFAQTEKPVQEIVKAKSDLSNVSLQNNPAFQENKMQGEMTMVSGEITEPVQSLKTRTKSNQTNERTTKPDGQDDGNPFPPKSSLTKGKPQKAGYDLKENKKI